MDISNLCSFLDGPCQVVQEYPRLPFWSSAIGWFIGISLATGVGVAVLLRLARKATALPSEMEYEDGAKTSSGLGMAAVLAGCVAVAPFLIGLPPLALFLECSAVVGTGLAILFRFAHG